MKKSNSLNLAKRELSNRFKSKFKIGMRFERSSDAENGLMLLIITKVSKHHLHFGLVVRNINRGLLKIIFVYWKISDNGFATRQQGKAHTQTSDNDRLKRCKTDFKFNRMPKSCIANVSGCTGN